jgi:hypothetical protein
MRLSFAVTVMAAVSLLVTSAQAQRATEVLIPIGQSPGVSGISSAIGTIASCDQSSRTVTISTDKEQHTATLSTETKIYLDRSAASAAKKSGTLGSRSDCQRGRRAEVKFVYEGEARTARVEWIKIQAE